MPATLVEQALRMALARRQPAAGLLHHSDRGSQYASHPYRALLETHHIMPRMSATGHCYDNAMKESFFATLKTECASHPFLLGPRRARPSSNTLRGSTIDSGCTLLSTISAQSRSNNSSIPFADSTKPGEVHTAAGLLSAS
jgi:transposase InsO family protein